MAYKYDKATNSLEQQPEMKEPVWDEKKHDVLGYDYLFYHQSKVLDYEGQKSLCKTYPVSGNCSWEDGQILGDKDFKLKFNGLKHTTVDSEHTTVEETFVAIPIQEEKLKFSKETVNKLIGKIDAGLSAHHENMKIIIAAQLEVIQGYYNKISLDNLTVDEILNSLERDREYLQQEANNLEIEKIINNGK